ncbi:uncharacterized protein JCM10292_001469 [Rhodotorula paludigena]|uniref:uncharacterized protein n=1 Tax=Rhodotorula paludigena TaxID=86838 RepID=UPI00317B0294
MDPVRAQMEAQTRQATVSMPLSDFLRCYDFSSPIRDEDWASKMVATPSSSPTVAPGQRARSKELPRYIVYLPDLAEQQVTALHAYVNQHLDPNVGANPDIVLAPKVWSEAVDFAEIPLSYAKQSLRTNGTSGCKSVAFVPPSLDPLLRADARAGATSFAGSQPVFGLAVHGEQVTYRTRVDFELRKGGSAVAVLQAASPEASRSNSPKISTFGKLASPFVGLTHLEITSSLPPSALCLDDVLGSGSTAFAYTHLPAGSDTPDVVVKIPRTSQLQEALVRSAQILQDLSGSGLAVELVAALYGKEGMYQFAMIEEYGGATLASWTDLNSDERTQVFLLAVRLHTDFCIEHGDLRPNNVVFTSDSDSKRRFRLIDFGHASTGHLCQVEAGDCSELDCLVKALGLEDDPANGAP